MTLRESSYFLATFSADLADTIEIYSKHWKEESPGVALVALGCCESYFHAVKYVFKNALSHGSPILAWEILDEIFTNSRGQIAESENPAETAAGIIRQTGNILSDYLQILADEVSTLQPPKKPAAEEL